MTRSFSHYTDGAQVYLTPKMKIFFWTSVVGADVFGSKPPPTEQLHFKCGRGLAPEEAGGFNAK